MYSINKKIHSIEEKIQSLKHEHDRLEDQKVLQTIINNHFDETIQFLKLFIPEHNKTACSDANPFNINLCDRCTVLAMEMDGFWSYDYIMDVSINKIT